jgi:diaminopimelate decarboxylase
VLTSTEDTVNSNSPDSGVMPDLGLFPAGTQLDGHGDLTIGGCSVRELAAQYGTPALIVNEAALRARATEFLHAFRSRHADSQVYFASKAFPSASVIGLLADEGLGFDVASGNEFAIAQTAGVDPGRMLLHGNAKSDDEIRTVINHGIEYIVIDNLDDIARIARYAESPQPVLLRVTPGIAARTHEANATGHLGSKFGVSMEQAPDVIARIRREPNIRLDGLHAHIGSQIFDLEQFREEVIALATLERFGVYDFGGGLATRYTSEDPAVSIDDYADILVETAHRHLGDDIRLLVEPGRSLVGSTAVSLYSVVTVKRDPRTHVAINGGMGDNLEVSLYGQRFQPWLVAKASNPPGTPPTSMDIDTVDLVGHHCESGDVLVADALLPRASVDDFVVVPVTGAYTYTMSNNYNAAFRPPIVFCKEGQTRLGVRRETLDDLLAREMLLPRSSAS